MFKSKSLKVIKKDGIKEDISFQYEPFGVKSLYLGEIPLFNLVLSLDGQNKFAKEIKAVLFIEFYYVLKI
jgi:hypothetical protein